MYKFFTLKKILNRKSLLSLKWKQKNLFQAVLKNDHEYFFFPYLNFTLTVHFEFIGYVQVRASEIKNSRLQAHRSTDWAITRHYGPCFDQFESINICKWICPLNDK